MTATDWQYRRAAGLAVAVVLPALISASLDLVDQPADLRPAAWFLLAVVAASLVGGAAALVVSTVISTLALWFSVSTPPHSFGALTSSEWWGIVGFVLVAGAIGLIVTRLETAVRERDTAVEARVRAEDAAAAQRELDATRAELFASELQQLRVRRNVDSLQEAMVPTELPPVDGFELNACYTPASPDLAVGGDWYDAFLLDDATLAFAVGDVSGHGVEAAALMAQLRNALRAYAFEDGRPADVLTRLNRFLCRLDTDQFATAVFGTVALDRAICRWATAGHPAPVFFRPGETSLGVPAADHGPLLGFRADAAYGETDAALEPGGGLLLYTDGLVERRGEHIDAGTERLRLLVHEVQTVPIEHLCDTVVERLAGGHEGRDDVCQLVVRRTAIRS